MRSVSWLLDCPLFISHNHTLFPNDNLSASHTAEEYATVAEFAALRIDSVPYRCSGSSGNEESRVEEGAKDSLEVGEGGEEGS